MPKLDLSLTESELDSFLGGQRTVRLATSGPDGLPHVVPLWYVWYDATMFMNSTLGNVTIRNLHGNPRVAGIVDDGEGYEELRGALLHGMVEPADGDPRIQAVSDLWSRKYMGGGPLPYGRWKNRVWLRMVPDRIKSWDFRKIPEAKERSGSKSDAGRG
jgi:nitroimidazol reductase NimA-like FMN-containing flavoprotein (pyridoxamine 5'-phosphate oxidase superfamily)